MGRRVGVRAFFEARVRLVDRRTGRELDSHPVSSQEDYRALALLMRGSKYERVFNWTLAKFARDVVRHPDTLIAIQRVEHLRAAKSAAETAR